MKNQKLLTAASVLLLHGPGLLPADAVRNQLALSENLVSTLTLRKY